VFHFISPRKDNIAFASLVEDVLRAYPSSDVYLVVDNFIIHKVGKIKDITEKESRLKMIFLPTYSPHLNPIEKLWRFIKQRVTSNHLFSSMQHLKEAVVRFFPWLRGRPQAVLSLIKGERQMAKELLAIT
jgi:putative transposase